MKIKKAEDVKVTITATIEHSCNGKDAWISEDRCEALRQAFEDGERVTVTVSKATEGEK
jgi:dienelactone hydrolase